MEEGNSEVIGGADWAGTTAGVEAAEEGTVGAGEVTGPSMEEGTGTYCEGIKAEVSSREYLCSISPARLTANEASERTKDD